MVLDGLAWCTHCYLLAPHLGLRHLISPGLAGRDAKGSPVTPRALLIPLGRAPWQ